MLASYKLTILILSFAGLFLFRYHAVSLDFPEGTRIKVKGMVSEDPTVEGQRQKVTIGQFRAYLDRFPQYSYGDLISIEGEAVQGKGGLYLKDAKVSENSQDANKSFIFSLRNRVLNLYDEYFPEPDSSLVKGIVLGTKSSLDFEFFEALRKTGTLHVVVASGTNITLLGALLLNVLSPLVNRRKAVFLTLSTIWLYVFLVGLQPPILRAGIMGSITFLAQALGREASAWRALLVSAGILLLINPLWLFDVGFELSFAATAGLLAFSSSISKRLALVPKMFRESLATTLSAQIAVSPILFLKFGQVSLISPLVNSLVLWTIPYIMAGGVITGILGIMSKPMGQVASWFVWLLAEYFVKVVELFGRSN